MGWGPDSSGINGVFLGKDVVKHAGTAMEMCVRNIAPKILTWKQYGEVRTVIYIETELRCARIVTCVRLLCVLCCSPTQPATTLSACCCAAAC